MPTLEESPEIGRSKFRIQKIKLLKSEENLPTKLLQRSSKKYKNIARSLTRKRNKALRIKNYQKTLKAKRDIKRRRQRRKQVNGNIFRIKNNRDSKFSRKNFMKLKATRPVVHSDSWIIMDEITSKILWGFNHNMKRQIASLTKIMTALLICEVIETQKINPRKHLCTVSWKASDLGGTSAQLESGDVLSAYDLLFCMLLPSGNDAAMTLAENFGMLLPGFECGEKDKFTAGGEYFIEQMNKKAISLGLLDCFFRNPHGKSDPLAYSSATSISKLFQECLKYDLAKKVLKSKKHWVKISRDGEDIVKEYVNSNKIVKEGFSGKTGWTKDAGPCFICNKSFRGLRSKNVGLRKIIIVILGCASMKLRFEYSRSIARWVEKNYEELIKLPSSVMLE